MMIPILLTHHAMSYMYYKLCTRSNISHSVTESQWPCPQQHKYLGTCSYITIILSYLNVLAPHAYLVVIGIAHNRHKHIDISGMCKYLYCYVYKVVNSPRNVTLWRGSSSRRALAHPHPPTPCGPLDQMLQFFSP